MVAFSSQIFQDDSWVLTSAWSLSNKKRNAFNVVRTRYDFQSEEKGELNWSRVWIKCKDQNQVFCVKIVKFCWIILKRTTDETKSCQKQFIFDASNLTFLVDTMRAKNFSFKNKKTGTSLSRKQFHVWDSDFSSIFRNFLLLHHLLGFWDFSSVLFEWNWFLWGAIT